MKYAWIENNSVRDIAPGNPAELYHPDVAKFYDTQIPDDIVQGATLIDGVWTNPPPPEPAVATPREPTYLLQLTPPAFMLQFTSAERVAIRQARATDLILDDFMQIVDDPRLKVVDLSLSATKGGIEYLVGKGILTQARADVILKGIEQPV